jgi:hypothetical protein
MKLEPTAKLAARLSERDYDYMHPELKADRRNVLEWVAERFRDWDGDDAVTFVRSLAEELP